MTEGELRKAITRHNLDAHADAIMAKAAPAFAISTGVQDPEPGASRFGGEPDMPRGALWPSKGGVPLGFLGQIRLSDVPSGAGRDALPERGRLLFFYDLRDGGAVWGFDPADIGSWAVLYEPDEDAFERTPLPDALLDIMQQWGRGEREPFSVTPLSFEPKLTIPGHEALGIELSASDTESYFELLDELDGETEDDDCAPLHQLLGHAAEVQGEMASECQLVSNGIDLGGGRVIDEARARALEPGAADWRLLLQIDTDADGPDWGWGDCGRLYFWIRHDDLVRRDFGSVWMILQCS